MDSQRLCLAMIAGIAAALLSTPQALATPPEPAPIQSADPDGYWTHCLPATPADWCPRGWIGTKTKRCSSIWGRQDYCVKVR
ncbi:hypothetical protein AB0H76_10000 [Nocardia sp. NPDC050712]|uniref:hypothetical protein n=1 Tax=Nocardia sp. NPDC050712 TaxID=3155518 RepID=UPI0033C66139